MRLSAQFCKSFRCLNSQCSIVIYNISDCNVSWSVYTISQFLNRSQENKGQVSPLPILLLVYMVFGSHSTSINKKNSTVT